MELQGNSQYVNLSSGINMIINISGRTPVCMVLKYYVSCAQTRRQTNHKLPREHVYLCHGV